jgi:hypothetical protein
MMYSFSIEYQVGEQPNWFLNGSWDHQHRRHFQQTMNDDQISLKPVTRNNLAGFRISASGGKLLLS